MKTSKNSQDSEMPTHNQSAVMAKLTTELHVLNRHRFIHMHNRFDDC